MGSAARPQQLSEAATFVGNDVVDLIDPEARGKARDARYVARVLDPRELAACTDTLDDALLWQIWSAKESAYKIIYKVCGTSATPRSLRVVPDEPWAESPLTGRVIWSDGKWSKGIGSDRGIPVRWVLHTEHVHCVAWWSSGPHITPTSSVVIGVEKADHPRLRTATLTPGEATTARNPHSAAVRALAKEMLDGAHRPCQIDSKTEILRPVDSRGHGPPALWRDGQRMEGHDLSLSHHGRYVAVALWSRPSHATGVSWSGRNE